MTVPDLIGSRHVAVVKAARRAKRSGEAEDFHRLRIRCKRLRYSLEFGSELYGGRTGRYTRQLTKLQNQLGLLQDAEVFYRGQIVAAVVATSLEAAREGAELVTVAYDDELTSREALLKEMARGGFRELQLG